MTYQTSTYTGCEEFPVNCTGDAVVGDFVSFERALFGGSRFKPYFAGFKLEQGEVVKDSYGRDKQQHTFTIERPDGERFTIKGRNLYANGTYRKLWDNEDLRGAVAEEKHARGNKARAAREHRLNFGV